MLLVVVQVVVEHGQLNLVGLEQLIKDLRVEMLLQPLINGLVVVVVAQGLLVLMLALVAIILQQMVV
jgi:hypothetical protein